jgi:hypothetical protein
MKRLPKWSRAQLRLLGGRERYDRTRSGTCAAKWQMYRAHARHIHEENFSPWLSVDP